jgi:ribosome-associated protein
MAAIKVTDTIAIDENEIAYDFVQASGPGGQNVNKVATAVQLRFDVRQSPSLPPDVRERLEHLAGSRLTQDGVLILNAQRFRSQERNRRDALARLVELIRQAARKPKRRRRTKPTATSRRRRLENKRHRAQIKKSRRPVRRDDE